MCVCVCLCVYVFVCIVQVVSLYSNPPKRIDTQKKIGDLFFFPISRWFLFNFPFVPNGLSAM